MYLRLERAPAHRFSPQLHEVGPWLPVGEQGLGILVVDTLDQRELDLGVVELLDVRPAALARVHGLHFDDLQQEQTITIIYITITSLSVTNRILNNSTHLDGVCTSPMTGTHVPIALGHGTADTKVTVLSVHVVGARTRIVTQPNAKVLDL